MMASSRDCHLDCATTRVDAFGPNQINKSNGGGARPPPVSNKLGIFGFIDNNQRHVVLLDTKQLSALDRRN
ncbi:hypothetical protein ABIB99_005532 [Bradyrhizobium sp. LA6.1]|uniref:hypothetical protein n=1 Tax=Bradyrhizobium sp. LA6.1 TaxID=3156378 RepID=UPI003397400C